MLLLPLWTALLSISARSTAANHPALLQCAFLNLFTCVLLSKQVVSPLIPLCQPARSGVRTSKVNLQCPALHAWPTGSTSSLSLHMVMATSPHGRVPRNVAWCINGNMQHSCCFRAGLSVTSCSNQKMQSACRCRLEFRI